MQLCVPGRDGNVCTELAALEPPQSPVQRQSDLFAGVNRPGRGVNRPILPSFEI